MELKVSPLAPAGFPEMAAVPGARMGAVAAGLKYVGRDDLTMFTFAEGTTVAGVQTRSTTAGAPVEWNRACLPGGLARALVVNAGNANVFTGDAGLADVRKTAEAAAACVDAAAEQVFVASTGVIGEKLPIGRLAEAVPGLHEQLGDANWHQAAVAIGTTDTFPKGATARVTIDGVPVTINGIAKGSGMIEPDMATMLSFVVTDAALPAPVLDQVLRDTVDRTLNCVTVDGDMSTSDMCLLFATGTADEPKDITDAGDTRLDAFRQGLHDVLEDLAIQIARDGEGAQKLITVRVDGAESDISARRVAKSVANSPLVKTAIAGEDANWGRIVMAVGKSREPADRSRIAVSIGGVPIAEDGSLRPGYDETVLQPHMQGREIDVHIDLGIGSGSARVWTCDLTHGYIEINGDYRS